jgi:PAS domain S-box-containing protein
VRELLELFDVRVQARSLAYLFIAGAALGLLTLVFPHASDVHDVALIVLAGIAGLIAVAMWLWADRVRAWQLHAALAAGTIILSLANYYVDTTVIYPLMYTWTALFAFYFFRVEVALAHLALIAVCYAAVLIVVDPPSAVVRWLLAVGTPLIAGLLISRLLGQLRLGVTDAERRTRALQESEARTRLVLDGAPDAFVSLDRDGVIKAWNSAAERLFGWNASEAIGVPFRSLVTPEEYRDRHDQRRMALIDVPQVVATQRYDTEFVRRDGTRFPAEATVSKIEIKGEPLISGFIRDVSERERRQQERETLLREQAARAEAERVAELVSGMQLLIDAALQNQTLAKILNDLTTRVRGVLQADAATILLADEDERLTVAASAVPGGSEDEEQEPAEPIALGEGFAGRVAQAREAMLSSDPVPADLPDPALARLEVDTLIGVPLLAENKVTGVLVAASVAPRRFSAEDLAVLRLAADRVALAIQHARVYEREHRIAETLQRSMLLRQEDIPQAPGLLVAVRYEPAATEADVGGDWYDVIPTPTGGLGLVMGDVAGKGLAAASMVSRLRSALRAYALEGHEPARVIEQLNRLVWTEGRDSQMATLLYMVVEPGESRVDWVNAGHPAPLLRNGDGPPRYLEGATSVPLGVLPFPSYETVTSTMEPGSSLVLFTDGLIERPGEVIDEGMAKLAARVSEAPADPEAVCNHLLRTMVPSSGATDDIAILTLLNLPFADRFRVEFKAEPETLSQMRSLLRRWLRHAGADDRTIAEVATAAGEAATNAIEHSGVADNFEVSGRVAAGTVELIILDHGRWRQPREGDQGRGLSLMRALMDTVELTPSPEGTTVRLRRRLDTDGGTE